MDLTNVQLIWPHTILVEPPYLDEEGGMFATPYAALLPRIFTTVLKAYKCDRVQEGDVIMFLPHHALDYYLTDHTRLWAMDERAALAVLEGW